MHEILNLSWQLQVALASGYAAYSVAYAGIKSSHTAIDSTFSILLFSAIATTVYQLTSSADASAMVGNISGFVLAIASGILWRKWIRRWLKKLLHYTRVSNATDTKSAWKELADYPELDVTQLAVRLKNGTWLRCDDTSKFADAPIPPVTLGADGGILCFLTHEEKSGEKARELKSVVNEEFGARINYIPPDEISQVTIRYRKRS